MYTLCDLCGQDAQVTLSNLSTVAIKNVCHSCLKDAERYMARLNTNTCFGLRCDIDTNQKNPFIHVCKTHKSSVLVSEMQE